MQGLSSHARTVKGKRTLALATLATCALGLSLLSAGQVFAQPGGPMHGQRMGPGGPVGSQDGPQQMDRGRGGPLGGLMQALRDVDLNREQRQQIREKMTEHRDAMKAWREANTDALEKIRTDFDALREKDGPLFEDMRSLHRDMDKLLRSDETTEAIMPKIAELRGEWFELRDQVKADAQPLRDRWQELHKTAPSLSAVLDDVVGVLTDEQREQAADAIAAARERLDRMADAPMPGMMMDGPRGRFDGRGGPDGDRPMDRRPMDGRGGPDKRGDDQRRPGPEGDGRGSGW